MWTAAESVSRDFLGKEWKICKDRNAIKSGGHVEERLRGMIYSDVVQIFVLFFQL